MCSSLSLLRYAFSVGTAHDNDSDGASTKRCPPLPCCAPRCQASCKGDNCGKSERFGSCSAFRAAVRHAFRSAVCCCCASNGRRSDFSVASRAFERCCSDGERLACFNEWDEHVPAGAVKWW